MKKYSIGFNYYGGALDHVLFSAPVYYNGTYLYMGHYEIDILEMSGDVITYDNGDGRKRRATLQLARWARGLHGNAPRGTYYGRYIVTLSNGARVSIPQHI